MSRTRARIVPHPPGPGLIESTGRGHLDPYYAGVGGPQLPNPLQPLIDALTTGVRTATADVAGAGQVLLGVVLLGAGLLLATGQMGTAARATGRAGLFAATRGRVR